MISEFRSIGIGVPNAYLSTPFVEDIFEFHTKVSPLAEIIDVAGIKSLPHIRPATVALPFETITVESSMSIYLSETVCERPSDPV